jgi:hypothetical protein
MDHKAKKTTQQEALTNKCTAASQRSLKGQQVSCTTRLIVADKKFHKDKLHMIEGLLLAGLLPLTF